MHCWACTINQPVQKRSEPLAVAGLHDETVPVAVLGAISEHILDRDPNPLENVAVLVEIHARVQLVVVSIVAEFERVLIAVTGTLEEFRFRSYSQF